VPKKTAAPSLRSLALDHIGAIAKALRNADPSLTQAAAVAQAARTPEGREAHRLYNLPGSHQPWPEALIQLTRAEFDKAGRQRTR
jgi:hypothetical protein